MRITSRDIAHVHRVILRTLQCVRNYQSKTGCEFDEKCSFLHRNGQTAEESKERWRKRVSGPCSDAEPPETNSISRKDTNSLRKRRRVGFTSKTLQSTKKKTGRKPSLGVVQPTHPHERSFFAPKYEERCQEDTLTNERCARREAWDMSNNVYKLKRNLDENRTTFLPPSEVSSCAIITKTRGKRFVINSGLSAHMLSRKDSNAAELETVRVSKETYKSHYGK